MLSTWRARHDGRRRTRSTLNHFERILPRVNAPGVLLFDDISWSPGMARAWRQIASHERTALAIDLDPGVCVVETPEATGATR